MISVFQIALASLFFTTQTSDESESTRIEIPSDVLTRSSDLTPRTETNRSHLHLLISSWEPAQLSLPTHDGRENYFETTELPQLGFLFESKMFTSFSLSVVGGFSFLTMQRRIATSAISFKQLLYLIPASLGMQTSPNLFLNKHLRPFLRAVAMPTLLLTSQSGLENDKTYLALPFQFATGLRWQIPGSSSPEVQASFTTVLGSIRNSSFFGIGIEGGLGISI